MNPRLYMLAGTSALLVIAVVATVVSLVRTVRRRRLGPEGPPAPQGTWSELPKSRPDTFDASLDGLEVEVHQDSPSAALLVPLRTGTWMPPDAPAPAENLPAVSLDKRIATFPASEPVWVKSVPDPEEDVSLIVPSAFEDEPRPAAPKLAAISPAQIPPVPLVPTAQIETVAEPAPTPPLPASSPLASMLLNIPEVARAAPSGLPTAPAPEPAPTGLPELAPAVEPAFSAPESIAALEPAAELAAAVDPLAALDAEELASAVQAPDDFSPATSALWSPPQVSEIAPVAVDPLAALGIAAAGWQYVESEPVAADVAAPENGAEREFTPMLSPERAPEPEPAPTPPPTPLADAASIYEPASPPTFELPVVLTPAIVRPPVIIHEPHPEPATEVAVQPDAAPSAPRRPRAVVRPAETSPVKGSAGIHLAPLAAQATNQDAGGRDATPSVVMAAPVEIWFGSHRVGVKRGTKTYEQFRRYADVLFDDLKAADKT